MKHKIITTLVFCLGILTSFAQPGFSWLKSIGNSTNQNEEIIDSYEDAAGNVYVTGYYHGTIDFNPSTATYFMTSKGGRDGFILKYKPNGNFDWVRGFGGVDPDTSVTVFEEGTSIAIDNSGDIIIGGRFNDSCIVYSNSQTFANLSGSGQEDVLLLKLSPTGNFIWAKGFGGSSADRLNSVATDKFNCIYAAGNFFDNIDMDPSSGVTAYNSIAGFLGPSADIFYTKFDASGNLIYGYRIGGNGDDYVGGMKVGSDNKIYLTGSFSNMCNFNPIPMSNLFMQTSAYTTGGINANSDQDIFVMKLDSVANVLWTRQVGGSNTHFSGSLSLSEDNEVHIGAWTRGQSYVYNSGSITSAEDTLSFNAIVDILMLKYDKNGNYMWGHSFGGPSSDICNTIGVDNDKNVYIGGAFYSFNVDMDPSAAVHKISLQNFSNGNQDAFIAKYDSLGNYLWSRSIGNTSATSDVINTLCVAPSGNEFVIGGLSNATNLDFDFSTLTSNFNSLGSWDGFTAKYAACSVDRSVIKDTTQLSVAPGYQSYQWINCATNAIIPGATQNTFNPTTNGLFACVITGSAGCTDTSSCILVDDVIDCSLSPIETNITVNVDTLSVPYVSGATYQWYFCSTNNPITSAGDSSKYAVVMNGSYKCKITLANGCFAFTPCYDFNQMGLEQLENSNSISIYPQPATQSVQIVMNKLMSQITIADLSGREIMHVSPKSLRTELNIESLAMGSYIAKITDSNGVVTTKKFTKISE